MANNEQIKVKELPVGYFVTDKYYQSGDYEFYNRKPENYFRSPETNMLIAGKPIKEIYGTKHIQLIAANPPLSGVFAIVSLDEIEDTYDNHEHRVEIDWQKANLFKEQGKDFFIYKVSEEK